MIFTKLTDFMMYLQNELYAQLETIVARCSSTQIAATDSSCYVTWNNNSRYAVPWVAAEDSSDYTKDVGTFPANCGMYSAMSVVETAALPPFLLAVSIHGDERYD